MTTGPKSSDAASAPVRPSGVDTSPHPSRSHPETHRPAWLEVNLDQLRHNSALIRSDMPDGLAFLSVVKDDAYGHGATEVARAAVETGAQMLAVYTLGEALRLREAGFTLPILLLGERDPDELPHCLEHKLTLSLGDLSIARRWNELAGKAGQEVGVHLKINTGMNRYGVRWDELPAFLNEWGGLRSLRMDGVMSHFAQSDEIDKTFARQQLERFHSALECLARGGIRPRWRHHCNSGGYLDLPEAHFDLVRLGILPLGVYPSAVCRRIPGIEPVMSLRAKVVAVRNLRPGDSVGYGMRFTASAPCRIAVLPLGYGDGYPRIRNTGQAMIHGQYAPQVGSVAMDTVFIDVTRIPQAQPGSIVTLMGSEPDLTARDLAKWSGTVCYDILTGWSSRLPRRYLSTPSIP